MSPGCESRINAGILQYFSGRLEEAHREFEDALKLCPNDPNAVLWKGKAELMMGRYDKAINTLRQSSSAEGRLWLSLALYLYSFLLDNPERERAIRGSMDNVYSLIVSKHDVKPLFLDLAKLLFAIGLAELGRVNEAREFLFPRERVEVTGPLLNMWYAYNSYFNGLYVDSTVELALISMKNVNLDDRHLNALLLDLVRLIKVRVRLKEKRYSEALNEASKVESTALKPLVLLYIAEAFEGLQLVEVACNYYREVLNFVNSPLVRSRLTQCTSSTRSPAPTPSRPLAKVVPISTDPKAFVGSRLGPYSVVDLIGCGGFGYAYEAEMGSKKYAIKVLKLEKGDPMAYFRELFNEANNLVNLSNHQSIVKIFAVHVDLNVISHALSGDLSLYYADPPRIVMEFMEGGNLEGYLKDDTFFYSSSWEKAVIKAVRQIAEALAYMHGKGYVHSDVKPRNIFLTRKPKDPSDLLSVDFKLGDLGSAVRVGKPVIQATDEYYPPEIFVDTAKPSMDVFALGITLYVLLTRKHDRPDSQTMKVAFDCYINNDMNCVKQKVEESKRLLAFWDPQVQEPFKTLIKRMTDPDPMKRPTADDIAKELSKF